MDIPGSAFLKVGYAEVLYTWVTMAKVMSWKTAVVASELRQNLRRSTCGEYSAPCNATSPATARHILRRLEPVLRPNRIATTANALNPMPSSTEYPALVQAAQKPEFSVSQ